MLFHTFEYVTQPKDGRGEPVLFSPPEPMAGWGKVKKASGTDSAKPPADISSETHFMGTRSATLVDYGTIGAIIVLLAFLVLMNTAAVILRKRFERRW